MEFGLIWVTGEWVNTDEWSVMSIAFRLTDKWSIKINCRIRILGYQKFAYDALISDFCIYLARM